MLWVNSDRFINFTYNVQIWHLFINKIKQINSFLFMLKISNTTTKRSRNVVLAFTILTMVKINVADFIAC